MFRRARHSISSAIDCFGAPALLSAALALGCSGAWSVRRLATWVLGDAQRSAASALSGRSIFGDQRSSRARRSLALGPPDAPHPRRSAFSFSHLLALREYVCAYMSFILACMHGCQPVCS
jgi:hypothetical protein